MAKEQKITPYLTVTNATKFLDFMKAGLGAKIVSKMPAEDGKRLMHAEAVVNGHSVYLSDHFPEYPGSSPTPLTLNGTPVTMHLHVKRPKDVDAWMARAAKAGAKIAMPAEDMFWGDRYGKVIDPHGHEWAFGAALPKPKMKPKTKTKPAGKAKAKPAAKRGRGK
jgi:PhnB protein